MSRLLRNAVEQTAETATRGARFLVEVGLSLGYGVGTGWVRNWP
jgi:hypothetical protein